MRWRWFAAVLLFGALLFVASFSSLPWECPPPPPVTQGTETAATNGHHCQSLQTLPLAVGQTIGGVGAWFWELIESHDKVVVAISTIVIAIFTVILGWSTVRLWMATDAMLQEAKNTGLRQTADMQASIAAAKAAADAAKDSAETSRTSMIAGDRAYVHFNGCRNISHPSDQIGGPLIWRIRPGWINSGNTPTRNLRIYVKYEILSEPLPLDYQFTPVFSGDYTATIAPRSLFESTSYDLLGTDLTAVKNGSKLIYVWGVANYNDVFPDTPDRTTKFCIRAANVTGNPNVEYGTGNAVEIDWMIYGRHNCADDECDTQP